MTTTTLEAVSEILANNLDKVKKAEDVKATDILYALGMDSYSATEIACEVEQEFAIKVSDSDVEKTKTVQDLVNLIDSRI